MLSPGSAAGLHDGPDRQEKVTWIRIDWPLLLYTGAVVASTALLHRGYKLQHRGCAIGIIPTLQIMPCQGSLLTMHWVIKCNMYAKQVELSAAARQLCAEGLAGLSDPWVLHPPLPAPIIYAVSWVPMWTPFYICSHGYSSDHLMLLHHRPFTSQHDVYCLETILYISHK